MDSTTEYEKEFKDTKGVTDNKMAKQKVQKDKQ
jgi:hypothetical protein